MKNAYVAFDALDDSRNVLHEFRFVKSNIFFDIKMEVFHYKESFVAGGYFTNIHATFMYASVIMCETLCIALMLAAPNFLHVIAAVIINA